MLNKPKGIITTVSDELGRKNVISFIKTHERIFPIGRLDKDTHGLLLLTNDGELTNKLIHPRYHIDKTYRLHIKGTVLKNQLDTLKNGVKLEDDGYGGIYTGSVLIGSILYEHGVVYFGSNTDQDTFGGVAVNSLQCNFSATNHIPMNVYICKAPKSLINFSTNPSYTVLSGTRNEITTSYPKVFVTGIGLYDENFELVGVAKLANPILFEEDEGAEFRLKLNF